MKLDVSERLKNIETCYQHAKSAIDDKLKKDNYTIINDVYNHEAFGSRYTTWSNQTNSIRLIWDGKDGWFYLEELLYSQPFLPTEWNTLTYIPYLEEHDHICATDITSKLLTYLGNK